MKASGIPPGFFCSFIEILIPKSSPFLKTFSKIFSLGFQIIKMSSIPERIKSEDNILTAYHKLRVTALL